MVPSFTFIFPLYRGGQVLLIEETGKSGKNHRPAAIQNNRLRFCHKIKRKEVKLY